MNCLACDRSISDQTIESCLDEKGVKREYLKCNHCGHLQLHPIPDNKELAPYYDSSYYGEGSRKFPTFVERWIDCFRNGRARRIAAQCPDEPRRALDIGCGNGRFLRSMSRYGFSIFGVELPGNSAERAKAVPDINLHIGTLDDADFEDASFSVVTIWHVLEHFKEPLDTLKRCRHLMQPEGRIFIEVPNGDSWQARLFGAEWFHRDPPRHITQYCRKSLAETLRQAGFKDIRLSTSSSEMGTYGFLQSLSDIFLPRKNMLYDILRSVKCNDLKFSAKVLALLVGILLLPLSLILTVLENICGHGAVLCATAHR